MKDIRGGKDMIILAGVSIHEDRPGAFIEAIRRGYTHYQSVPLLRQERYYCYAQGDGILYRLRIAPTGAGWRVEEVQAEWGEAVPERANILPTRRELTLEEVRT